MKISINLVHTNYGNHHLFKNETLMNQLYVLAKASSLYEINLLLNGEEAITNYCNQMMFNKEFHDFIHRDSIFVHNHRGNPLTHGAAIQKLHEVTKTSYYILIDEDDEFRDNYLSVLRSFVEIIHMHDYSKYLLMYGFNWMYIKEGSSELRKKIHPTEDKNEKLDSVAGLSNWNFLFNKRTLDKLRLVRPDINKYDDNLYYLKLYQAYKGECLFLDYNLINYRKDHSTLSIDSSCNFDNYMNYLLQGTGFKIIKTISK